MNTLLVLCGGESPEFEVSENSGKIMTEILRESGHPTILNVVRSLRDFISMLDGAPVFPVFHGGWGEDGTAQSILENLGIPFFGSRYAPSFVGMSKTLSKMVARDLGILTPEWNFIRAVDDMDTSFLETHSTLVFKPNDLGSSKGVSLLTGRPEELHSSIASNLLVHDSALVEAFIPGCNFTVAVYSNRDQTLVFSPLEIGLDGQLYDDEAKQTGRRTYKVHRRGSKLVNALCGTAERIHCSLGCSGFTRSDFIVTNKGEINFLEINTSPGFGRSGNLLTILKHDLQSDADIAALLVKGVFA